MRFNHSFTGGGQRIGVHLGWFVAFMLSAQPSAQPDPRSWYGFRIGDAAPSATLDGESQGGYRSGLAVPSPWTNVAISKDEQGRISAISLREECCGEILLDVPPHAKVPPPTVYVSPTQMMIDGKALMREALRRLGPPNRAFDLGSGVNRQVTMQWNFAVEFRRCQGPQAIFDSPAHEPSGTLGEAYLRVDRDEITLDVAGKNDPRLASSNEPTRAEIAKQQESCRRDVALSQWLNNPELRRRECAKEPDVCTVIEGAIFYHARGERAKQIPCPPGNTPICRCFTFVGADNVTPANPSMISVNCSRSRSTGGAPK